MTSSSVFVERSRAPLLPANFFFFPEFVFPRLPINPLALLLPLLPLTPLALLLPLLPMTPLALLLPLLPMTPLAPLLPPVLAPVHLALSLKQPMQNLARGETALFQQRGLIHFFTMAFALAAVDLAPVHLALSLKQPMQNLARGEAALFQQLGLLHFFTLAFALAAG